jgi:hypothetical protein
MESDSIYQSSEDEWRQDVLLAKSVIEDAISKMSTPLRVEACCVGYQLWKISEDARYADSLGTYTRSIQRIRLFLSNIREQCSENGDEFSELVVTTYLHELGKPGLRLSTLKGGLFDYWCDLFAFTAAGSFFAGAE